MSSNSLRRPRRMMRILTGLAVGLATIGITLLPASPASAEPLNDCRGALHPKHVDQNPWRARGNYHDAWSAPSGIVDLDSFRITATGNTRIDYWGATKSVNGDPALAPTGWPLPGERQFILMAKVTKGNMWHDREARWYGANQWFPVGSDSSCLKFNSFVAAKPAQLVFGINDPNIGDNGGGPYVTVRQWW